MKTIKKVTPLLVFILVLSILIIQEMIKSSWNPMYFLVIVAAVLDFGLLLLLDYLLVRNMNIKYVFVIEIIIIVFIVFIKWHNKLSLYDILLLIY